MANWTEIESGLAQQAAARPAAADAFWQRFREQAAEVEQEPAPLLAFPRRPAIAAAAAAVAAVGLAVALYLGNAPTNKLNQIKSLEVAAAHAGVMIMNDEASQSTIVWINEITTAEGGEI